MAYVNSLRYEQMNWASRGVTRYTFIAKNFDFNRFDRLDVSRTPHHEGKSNKDVTGLFISECWNMRKFAPIFAELFPNLTALSVNKSGLESISVDDLKGFKRLKEVFVANNHMEHLSADLFRFNPDLVLISLYNNGIKFIDPEIFDHLKHIEKIILLQNATIDEDWISSKGSLHSLKQKILSDCLLPDYEERKKLKQQLEEQKEEAMKSEEMLKDLKKFLSNEAAKDLTLIVAGREFKVHKFLLAMRVPTIAEIINNNPEAERLELVDIPVEIFEAILVYLYTDQKPPQTSNFVGIFKAASKLRIKSLQKFAAKEAWEKLFPGKELNENIDDEKLVKILDAKMKLDEATKVYEEEMKSLRI